MYKAVAYKAGRPVNGFAAGIVQWRRRRVRAAASIRTWRTEQTKLRDSLAPCIIACPLTRESSNRSGIWERNDPVAPAMTRVDATGPTEDVTKRRFAWGHVLSRTTTRDRYFAPQRTTYGRADAAARPSFIVSSAFSHQNLITSHIRSDKMLNWWRGPVGSTSIRPSVRLTARRKNCTYQDNKTQTAV